MALVNNPVMGINLRKNKNIAAMEGLNPNEVVKAIHIRFIPNQSKLDNLAGPAFKDQCSLELRNIIDTWHLDAYHEYADLQPK